MLQRMSVVKHFILALKIGHIEHRESEKLLETEDLLESNYRGASSRSAHLLPKIIG